MPSTYPWTKRQAIRRRTWLAKRYHDEYGDGFRTDDDGLVPITSRVPEFQEVVHRLVAEQGIEVPARAGRMRVKDVGCGAGRAPSRWAWSATTC